jgi:hypothetical protein
MKVKFLGSKFVVCAREGWANTISYWRRISQSEIRNLAAAEKSESESEGG